MAAGGAAGSAWSDGLRSLTSSDPPAVYPAMRLAIAAAIIVAASPHLSRPLRTLGRLVVTLGALASITLGVAEPIGVVAGLAVGLAGSRHGASAARFARRQAFPRPGRASPERISAWRPRTSGTHRSSPAGYHSCSPPRPTADRCLVKIYGRDAWDGQLLTSIWSSLWNRGETPEFGGRLHQVEHEAFVTLFAERQGVSAMPVVAAGMAAGRDAVLVVATRDAQPLAQLDPARVDDALLTRIWELDARLFDLRVAHGALDGFRVAVYADGTPAVGDFSQATVSASRRRPSSRPSAAPGLDRAAGRSRACGDHRPRRARRRRDRRDAALPATGSARPGHTARGPGPGLGPGRPSDNWLRMPRVSSSPSWSRSAG